MLSASGTFAQIMDGEVSRIRGFAFTASLGTLGTVDLSKASVSWSIDGSMNNTNVPDQLAIKDGVATRGGTITVGGLYDESDETKTLWWLLNPDNPNSPLYRQDLRDSTFSLSAGVYEPGTVTPELLPVITNGTITSYQVAHDGRSVEFQVTDQAPGWGNLPAAPAVVTAPPWNARLTSEYVMDALIRSQQASSTWPATRANSLLAVGLHASLWPDVGTLNTDLAQPFVGFAACAYGTGLSSQFTLSDLVNGYSLPTWNFVKASANTLHIEFLFTLTDTTSAAIVDLYVPGLFGTGVILKGSVAVQFISGAWNLSVLDASSHQSNVVITGGLTIGAVHHAAFDLSYSGGTVSGTVKVDAFSSAFSALTSWAGGALSALTAAAAAPVSNAAMNGLQITTENAPTWSPYTTPSAVLDPSLNPLTVIPAIDAGTAAWDELQTLAQAELGYLRRDAAGIIRFSNRNTLASSPIVSTLRTSVNLVGLGTDMPAKQTYDRVQVAYDAWTFEDNQIVFTAGTALKVPAVGGAFNPGVTTFTFTLSDELAARVDTSVAFLIDGTDPLAGGSHYRASTGKFGVDEFTGSMVGNITAELVSPTRLEVTVVNPYFDDLWFVNPASRVDLDVGVPSLWIGGTLATSDDSGVADVSRGAGTTVLRHKGPLDPDTGTSLDSNKYLQDPDTANDLAAWILALTRISHREFTDVTYIPDHRHEIGDKVGLVWPEAFIADYAYIWGLTFAAAFPPAGQEGGDWSMSADVTTLGPPGAWIGGVAGRSEGGVTTYGY